MYVGKEYIKKGGNGAIRLKCVYVTDMSKISSCANGVAILKYEGGAEESIDRRNWIEWQEAPDIKTFVRDVILDDENFKLVHELIPLDEKKHIGQVNLTIVNGLLKSVDVIG